jgi:hypothetical protein
MVNCLQQQLAGRVNEALQILEESLTSEHQKNRIK